MPALPVLQYVAVVILIWKPVFTYISLKYDIV